MCIDLTAMGPDGTAAVAFIEWDLYARRQK
jgi:hypothetical protein